MTTRITDIATASVLFLSAAHAPSASAGVVTWTLTAHVTSVTQTNTALTNRSISIVNGDAVTMTWSFDNSINPTQHDVYSDPTLQSYRTSWDFATSALGAGSLSASVNGLVWSAPEFARAQSGFIHDDPARGRYQSRGSLDSNAHAHDLDSAFCGMLCQAVTRGAMTSPVGLNSVIGTTNHNYLASLGFELSDFFFAPGGVTQFLDPGVPNSVNLNQLSARNIRISEQAERNRNCVTGPDGRPICAVEFIESYSITALIDSISMSVTEDTAVPAPGALAIMLLGLIGGGAMRRRALTVN